MKQVIILYSLFILLAISGCCVYNPQPTDIPLINSKHDLRIEAGASLVPSVFATVSYGLTKKLAIQAYGLVGSDERHYFQFAPGYFKQIDSKKVMEVYAGYGFGYGNAYKDAIPGHMYGDYQLFFSQFNFGISGGKKIKIDYGAGLKAGYLTSNLTDQNYHRFYSEDGPFNTYDGKDILVEPALFIRIGGEKLKLSIKAGACYIHDFANPDEQIPSMNYNLGLGLNLNL